MTKGNSWREYFQRGYQAFAERFPRLREITSLLPDSVYEIDPRHTELTEQRNQLSASNLETTAQLAETRETVETTRGELEQARRNLKKYEVIGDNLRRTERIAAELLVALEEQRIAYQQGEARRTVDHETRQKEFGVAINPSGMIIGASRRALNRFDEKKARGTSLYNYLTGESDRLIEVIHDAVQKRAKTASFEGLSVRTPSGKTRKIGDVNIRLYYCPSSPIIYPNQPYKTSEAKTIAFAAASIVTKDAHQKTVRVRRKRMQTARNKTVKAQERKTGPAETTNATGLKPALE